MNYNDKLKAAIAEKNVIAARTQILIYLGHDEKEAKPVAVKIANEIAPYFTDPADPFFEADNNYLETPAENLWDQDFYNKLVAYLRLNFSKEKLELAQRVILKLRSNGVRDFQVVSTVHRQETPVRPRVNSIPEKKNTQHYVHPEYPTPAVSIERRTRPQHRKSPKQTQSEFLAGAIVGGVALGGAGLLIGLIAGCAVKATLSGIVIGGIAGGLLNQNKKRR